VTAEKREAQSADIDSRVLPPHTLGTPSEGFGNASKVRSRRVSGSPTTPAVADTLFRGSRRFSEGFWWRRGSAACPTRRRALRPPVAISA